MGVKGGGVEKSLQVMLTVGGRWRERDNYREGVGEGETHL